MKRSLFVTTLLLIAVLVSACQPAATQLPAATPVPVDIDATIAAGLEQTSAAMPTQPPPAEPPPATEAPAPTAVPEQPTTAPQPEMVTYSPSLTGVVWEWLGTSTGGQFTAVADPSLYQVEFQADGSAQIKADCNNVLATYTIDGSNLVITLGPSTLVACPEGSQADLFVQQLGTVAQYSFESIGNLNLTLGDGSLMVFSPQPVAVLPTPEPGAPSLTATTNVNVRSGPSESYPIYGVMPAGRVASLIGVSEDAGWWVVSLPVTAGGIGWVSASFSSATNGAGVPVYPTPPLPDPLQPVTPAEGDPQATSLETAYVRQGPGETYPVYGTVPAGVTGRVIGRSQDNSYWVVRVNPEIVTVGFGWISASSTSTANIENIPVVQAPPAPQPVQTTCTIDQSTAYAVANTSVNLREGPSTAYPVVGGAQPGQCGQIVGRNNDSSWWAISTTQGVVWVSAPYVNAYNTANVPVLAAPPLPPDLPVPPPPDQPSSGYVITTEPVNVRTGPGNQFPSLGKVPAGTVFQVLGSAGGWLNVSLPGSPNNQGWISASYAMPYLGPVATPF